MRQDSNIPYDPATFRTKRTVPGVVKAFDADEGILEGYASLTGVLDSYKEIVDKGAFKRTLKEHAGRIALCWQHDWREVIGRIEEIREVSRSRLPKALQEQYPEATGGLHFRAQVLETRQGQDAKVLLRAKAVKEMSIGFDLYEDGHYKDDDGIVHLSHIKLYEISPVTMGANPGAQIGSYKAEEPEIPYDKPEETEDFIRIPNPAHADCEVTATITISEEEGITALYCGKIKKVRTFIFAKAKGWTMAKAQKWVDDHKDEFKGVFEVETKGVIPYKQTPKAPEDAEWDASAEVAAAEVSDLKVMCAWFGDKGENKGDYKLPHHKAAGAHAVVWRGVAAAGAVIMGARGGAKIPDSDVPGVKRHLGRHYKEFDKEPPWEKAERALRMLIDNQLKKGYNLLRELVSELPQLTLGEAEELALRISILEAETDTL